MTKTMNIEGMMCGHCEARVKKALEALAGVESAEVSHEKGTCLLYTSLVVPITLFSGMIFRSILNDDIWTVFGLICGLRITSCLIEIIYHFDFKSCLLYTSRCV